MLMSQDEDLWESNRTYWWRVESSAKEWMALLVEENRSLLKRRKSVGEMTEPCGTRVDGELEFLGESTIDTHRNGAVSEKTFSPPNKFGTEAIGGKFCNESFVP